MDNSINISYYYGREGQVKRNEQKKNLGRRYNVCKGKEGRINKSLGELQVVWFVKRKKED